MRMCTIDVAALMFDSESRCPFRELEFVVRLLGDSLSFRKPVFIVVDDVLLLMCESGVLFLDSAGS